MAKILLVEDEPLFSDLIEDVLKEQKHVVDVVPDGQAALNVLRWSQYDLIILDWNLPGLAGVDVLKAFRARGGSAPVLMLTAKSAVEDKETGLDSGADDYLTKPFHEKELAARVRSLLRRPAPVQKNLLEAGGIALDTASHRVVVDGREVNLLPKEFSLLEFFMRHPGQTFSNESLIERVWSAESDASPDSIRTYVKRLRAKIDVEGRPSLFSTVYGVGYRFDPPPDA